MVRYRVRYWDSIDEREVEKRGWAFGSSFSDGAKTIESYYGDDLLELTIRLFDNWEDEVVEDGYLENEEDV